MSHDNQTNNVRKRVRFFENRTVTDHLQQQQQSVFSSWDFPPVDLAERNDQPTGMSIPEILHGPQDEVTEIEAPSFQIKSLNEEKKISSCTLLDENAPESAAVTSPVLNQGSSSITTDEKMAAWLAGLDLDNPPRYNPKPPGVTFVPEFDFLIPVERRQILGSTQYINDADGRYCIPFDEYGSFGVPSTLPAERFIAQILNGAGLRAVSNNILEEEDKVEDPELRHQLTEDCHSVSSWHIKADNTVRPDRTSPAPLNSRWHLLGMKLTSPKLPFEESGFLEVEKALSALRKRVRLSLSTSTAFYVHIDASILTLPERHHFLSLYLMIEDVLFSFIAPHRSSTSILPTARRSVLAEMTRKNLIHRGISTATGGSSRERATTPEGHDSILFKAYEQQCIIWSTEEMEELAGFLDQAGNPGACTALAMKKHVGGEKKKEDKWAFEFRHSQGTLRPEVARQWTRLCGALVLAAKGLGEYNEGLAGMAYHKFEEIARDGADCMEVARFDLLEVLELLDAEEFWIEQVEMCEKNDGGWLEEELNEDGFAPVLEELEVDG